MSSVSEHDPRYLLGVEHFNRGEYFEAHEAWEELWLDCDPIDRRFFQSLIQAAVALYHWGNGNRTGACRLFAAGREKAWSYRPAHRGLDVESFWQQVESALEGALTGLADSPGTPPTITLAPPACP